MKSPTKLKHVTKKYIFSFVVAVYNTEKYLEETVNSILEQDFPLESIQIILVNDGSTDNSGRICEEYKKRYPENIVYIDQKNGGVSKARNAGIAKAEGEYISFLDSDDKISPDTLNQVYEFFKNNDKEIDVVSIKMKHFDASNADHILNYIYEETRIVDIRSEFNVPQLSTSSVFIKRSALKDRRFCEDLKHLEDARLMTEILLDKMKFGVLSQPVYWYRKRIGETSASTGSTMNKSWYINALVNFHEYVIRLSIEKQKKVLKYVQFLVMYDLQWRLRQSGQNVLDPTEEREYKRKITTLLESIDADIIMAQRHLPIEYKVHALSLKHDADIMKTAVQKDSSYFVDDVQVFQYETNRLTSAVQIIEGKGNEIKLHGLFRGLLFEEVEFGFIVDGVFIATQTEERPNDEVKFLDETIFTRNPFQTTIKVEKEEKFRIRPAVRLKDGRIVKTKLELKHLTRITNMRSGYRLIGNRILLNISGDDSLEVCQTTKRLHLKRELAYVRSLFYSRNKISDGFVRVVLYRLARHITKIFKRKEIWIISDRVDSGGDNGEALFRYLGKNVDSDIKIYFAIDKKSKDYSRLSRIGKVVNRCSWYYKLLFLICDKNISSAADDFVVNPFNSSRGYVHDLYDSKFVFLQHGITKDDMSRWLGKYSKNIAMFVAAAKPEYKDLLTPKYCYDSSVIQLTGFPRHDLLTNNAKNKIVVTPTWRRHLTNNLDQKTMKREPKEGFNQSDYYNFYQSLLSSKKLISALEKHNYTLDFYVHPAIAQHAADFTAGTNMTIKTPPYDYRKAFNEGSLMVTDYSSVAFDFAYLRKPVVYCQFDKATFYDNHAYERGYFSYEKEGLGPVYENVDETIDYIIQHIKNDTMKEDKYKKRADDFFAYSDKNNCRRTIEAIKAMD